MLNTGVGHSASTIYSLLISSRNLQQEYTVISRESRQSIVSGYVIIVNLIAKIFC